VLFETFVHQLEFGRLLPEFGFDVAGAEDVLEVDPIFLNYQPVVDNKHGVVDNLLQFFCLYPLSLQIPVAQNGAEIG
jgi:hypothetical protein